LRNIARVPLYLLDLLIEDYLCSLAQLLYHFRDPDVVAVVAVVGGKLEATVTTWSSESVVMAMSTAVVRASSASLELSVARRILVGKMLMAALSFPLSDPGRCMYLWY
jgi:hypothetical protein